MKRSEIKHKVVSGSAWTLFANVSSQAISFLVTVVLARLLTPVDFGVVAISAVFIGVITLFQDVGMGAALIQRKEIDDDYLSTSFSVSLLAGAVLAGLIAAISPLVASFYGQAVLRDILLVSSIGFLLSPFTSIHTSILSKSLEFKKVALIQLGTQAVSGSISVGLALSGYGLWSMVLGKILSQPLLIPVVWSVVKWRPRLKVVRKCFTDLFGFSSHLLGFNLLNFFARSLDNLIIGKYLGPQALGYYSVAYNLMLKPLQLISWSIGKVLFPVFSSIQDDPAQTRAVYLKIIKSISLITFPMMTGLFMVAEEFILSVYGDTWRPAILPLKLLCAVGAIQSIGTTAGVIFNSQGRSDLNLKVGAVSATSIVIGFIIGINWGVIGLITAYIAVSLPIFFLGQFYANRLIGLEMGALLSALVPAAACSGFMVAVLAALRYMSGSMRFEVATALVLLILLGAASYILFAAKVFKVDEVNEAIQMVKRKL
jgi:PST family polysaccharide transporter